MKTRVKLTVVQKYEELGNKLSNKELVNELIAKYQNDTKNAVQNIINMCKTVKAFEDKVKGGLLTEDDLNYFCLSVNLDRKSSTFRKYTRIAERADMFEKYLDAMPAAYTILYEITTLNADQFEMLLNSNLLTSNLTLLQVKNLTNKKVKGKRPSGSVKVATIRIRYKQDAICDESKNIISHSVLNLLKDRHITIDSPDETVLIGDKSMAKCFGWHGEYPMPENLYVEFSEYAKNKEQRLSMRNAA
jgi:hypothetical protein